MCNEDSSTIRSETCFKNGNRINLDFMLTFKSIFSKLTPLSQAESEQYLNIYFFSKRDYVLYVFFTNPTWYAWNLTWQLFKCHYNYDLCIYELLKKKRCIFNTQFSCRNAKDVLGYTGMYV